MPPLPRTRTPLPLLPGVSASAIDAGDTFTCAIVSGGGVKCWGNNNQGQLGVGNIVVQEGPVTVNGARGYIYVYIYLSIYLPIYLSRYK
jgi:alpha-tubulin suppressor-like RCC1 family protein